MLDKFNLTKNDDGSFDVQSKVSDNKATVKQCLSEDPVKTLLWTILNDLYDEGYIADSD